MPARCPRHWYQHKPRVIRRRWSRTLATVAPDLSRTRGWVWTVDRLSQGIRDEHARGRTKSRAEAAMIAGQVGAEYNAIFTAENRARIMRG